MVCKISQAFERFRRSRNYNAIWPLLGAILCNEGARMREINQFKAKRDG